MAEVVVLNGTLPTSGSVDLTRTSIGTPSGVIVIASNANSTNNPQDNAVLAVGLYDGTTQACCSIFAEDGQSTTNTSRTYDAGSVFSYSGLEYTASFITDGVRLTLSAGTTSVARYVTVVLFCGASCKVGVSSAPTTGNTTSSGSLGFTPGCVFALGIGNDLTSSGTADHSIFVFGVAESGGTQRCFLSAGRDIVLTTIVNQYVHTSAITGQIFNDAVNWFGNLSSWSADSFAFGNVSGDPSGDDILWLAVDDSFNVDIHSITSPAATGNDTISSLSLNPEALLCVMSEAAAENSLQTAGRESFGIGAADGTNQGAYCVVDEDNTSTTNAASASHSDQVIDVDSSSSGTRSDVLDATLSSFGTAQYTLNYSATSSGLKGFGVAFAVAGGGPTTIDCTLGTVTITGQAATVSAGTTINCTLGAVTVAGQAADVSVGTTIACTAGAVTVAGQAATITAGTTIECTAGAVTVAGQAATISAGTTIDCTTGAVAIAGNAVEIDLGTTIDCTLGEVVIAGQAATVSSSTTITCTAGGLAVAGHNVTVAQATTVNCTLGQIVLAALACQVSQGATVSLSAGAVTVAGHNVSITTGSSTTPDGVDYAVGDYRPHYKAMDNRPHYGV